MGGYSRNGFHLGILYSATIGLSFITCHNHTRSALGSVNNNGSMYKGGCLGGRVLLWNESKHVEVIYRFDE